MSKGKLKSRPQALITSGIASRGLFSLPSLEAKRSGLIYIPKSYKDSEAASLILMLHGAGCEAKHGIDPLIHYADDHNFILVAPKSKDSTWDCIRHKKYGEDVAYIDKVLHYIFESFNINSRQIFVEGFSDGATYALSLGLANRDLFSSIMAFSPGYIFFPSGTSLDTLENSTAFPRIFFSHGSHDQVLSVEYCSRRIDKNLTRCGIGHHYYEFKGGHTILPQCITEALKYCYHKPKEVIIAKEKTKELVIEKEKTKEVITEKEKTKEVIIVEDDE